jgi:c-di-GMP-binding flagellar brake protein YcgR
MMSKYPDKLNTNQNRKHSRQTIITSVDYKVLTPSGDVGMTQNVSEGGLCLMLNNELSPGTILEVKFEIPGDDPKQVESLVEVIWQKKTNKGLLTGVKFHK